MNHGTSRAKARKWDVAAAVQQYQARVFGFFGGLGFSAWDLGFGVCL